LPVVSTVPAPPDPTQPIETPFADAASPFKRTETNLPAPVFIPPSPSRPVALPQSHWVTYRSQINFGLAIVAFLMMLVGAATVIEANPEADWARYVALAPAIPGMVALYIFVRGLMSLDEIQARIQLYALGLSLGATALATFGYGFFEGAGLPDLPPATVLPLMAVCWGLATAFFAWRYRRS
jgi:hypothetical protein